MEDLIVALNNNRVIDLKYLCKTHYMRGYSKHKRKADLIKYITETVKDYGHNTWPYRNTKILTDIFGEDESKVYIMKYEVFIYFPETSGPHKCFVIKSCWYNGR